MILPVRYRVTVAYPDTRSFAAPSDK
ncbi:hypothetical protein BCEP27_30858 [Burkholderia cepacia]